MAKSPENPNLLATDQPDLFFEDNTVGRCKKEVWDASDEEIDQILADYGIPSPCEWGTAGSYIQTTVRQTNRLKSPIAVTASRTICPQSLANRTNRPLKPVGNGASDSGVVEVEDTVSEAAGKNR